MTREEWLDWFSDSVEVKRYDLVPFTRALCNTLVAWGMDAEYEPQADLRRQIILTYDGGEPFFTVTVDKHYISLLGMVCTTLEELLARLPDAIQRRRNYRAHLRTKDALRKYCKGCWYSDEEVEHCGMGRPLSLDCVDYTPMEEL